jgi:heme/copper-type cytochrome/quinol oxidase subunit 3
VSKNAKGLIIGLLIALTLLLGAAFACLAFYEPYRSAQSSMPEDGAMALV